ncbi:MAG: right-handed parallel beta-helix repeat-containing protein [Gaiella sp.]|nr:right-handed parallel beta-helix repeat-containing protein [Gaiella sp.]
MFPWSVARAATAAVALAAAVALVQAGEAGASTRAGARQATVRVGGEVEFDMAARALRSTGGTIVLRPRLYRRLVVRWRSDRRLRIVGTRGARIERVDFEGARNVSLGNVTIGPIGGDALVDVRGSRGVVLHDLVVTAKGTRFSATVRIPDSRGVTIRRSDFSHCGDRSRRFARCVLLWRWSHRVLIEDSRFHDCRGCDFVHGRFGSDLVIRRNRFDRALPCRGLSRHRCGHQDLVQLFAGRRLTVERNRFGVYRDGGAQLYLTNSVDHATIVNNVFVGTDPRVPGYRARMAIIVGSAASKRLPHYARVVNNTILTGTRRRDGYAGSIRMSSKYGSVLRRKRPIVANNVIALLEKRAHICSAARLFAHNVVLDGTGCAPSDRVGPAGLDGRGRPRRDSAVVDAASRRYAPTADATGRRRIGRPDVGALEYRRG